MHGSPLNEAIRNCQEPHDRTRPHCYRLACLGLARLAVRSFVVTRYCSNFAIAENVLVKMLSSLSYSKLHARCKGWQLANLLYNSTVRWCDSETENAKVAVHTYEE